MQGAQGQPVLFNVWATHGVPLNVRSFQTCWQVPQTKVKAAHAASVLIDSQHALSEGAVSLPALTMLVDRFGVLHRRFDVSQIQTKRVGNVLM